MKRNGLPRVVIAGAARTPVGLKCGTLSDFAAEDLAVLAAEEAIHRSGVARERIDAAIGANVYQYTAPGAQDIYFPRNVALRCHLNTETPALMVQRICGSGLQTVVSALHRGRDHVTGPANRAGPAAFGGQLLGVRRGRRSGGCHAGRAQSRLGRHQHDGHR